MLTSRWPKELKRIFIQSFFVQPQSTVKLHICIRRKWLIQNKMLGFIALPPAPVTIFPANTLSGRKAIFMPQCVVSIDLPIAANPMFCQRFLQRPKLPIAQSRARVWPDTLTNSIFTPQCEVGSMRSAMISHIPPPKTL